ncbi:MAG: XdhC family protein [Planctomycetaceae bacterium]|jgi:xanthine dehydrogenase accessory factor|nr:XdhC family protein [Planctomycetaceae bacterium]MBT6155837.1 XdhC family protein [Planctomycetaceae bacterium]MBT6484223.1 XdhC family protein [Planctomycetaceae bacterium]MBT6495400.1 XdhC family protein [Planctomycetaceae bacterium]
MQNILQDLEEVIRHGKSVAYTALVETRGSTPQKAGAMMLVYPDGSQTGTLGGGCVEAEVKRRALRLLDEGEREILSFQLDSDYGWDDGLICGGRMRMLVDPIRPTDDLGYYHTLAETINGGLGCTETIVLDDEQTGAKAADRFLLDVEGNVLASRCSGEVPASLAENLRPLVRRPRPYVVGGISYLPRLERCRLLIVGAGHVGQKVAAMAHDADFDIWVIDDREQYCNPERFPQAKRLIVDNIDTALSGLDVDPNTYCIIVTRGHNHDEEALYHLAEKSARYVGMIGSKRKIKLIFDDLLKEGVSREALAKVYAPLGFDIGSQTVPEIAISIVAELIAHRNLGAIPERVRPDSLMELTTDD